MSEMIRSSAWWSSLQIPSVELVVPVRSGGCFKVSSLIKLFMLSKKIINQRCDVNEDLLENNLPEKQIKYLNLTFFLFASDHDKER